MGMICDRPYKRQLHNFNLTRLRWGNQKHMMCLKDSDHSSSSSASVHRRSAMPSLDRTRFDVAEEEGDEIDAFRERLMSTETDKIKEELLKGGEEECEMEQERAKRKLARAAVITGRWEEYEADKARPWNLRTRRAACKAAAAKNGSPARKEGVAEKEKASLEKKKEREKFAVALTRMEIEEDFLKLTAPTSSAAEETAACLAEATGYAVSRTMVDRDNLRPLQGCRSSSRHHRQEVEQFRH